MLKNTPHYYALKIRGIENPPSNLFYQSEHNELFISAAMRLCGFAKMAHIENKKIAEAYKKVCEEKFANKYGGNFSIEISEWNEGFQISKPTLIKIVRDTDKIIAHIKAHNAANNTTKDKLAK